MLPPSFRNLESTRQSAAKASQHDSMPYLIIYLRAQPGPESPVMIKMRCIDLKLEQKPIAQDVLHIVYLVVWNALEWQLHVYHIEGLFGVWGFVHHPGAHYLGDAFSAFESQIPAVRVNRLLAAEPFTEVHG